MKARVKEMIKMSELDHKDIKEVRESPDKLNSEALGEDIERCRMAMNSWIKDADANKPASPYVKNNYTRPYSEENLPDEDNLVGKGLLVDRPPKGARRK